MRRSAKNMEFPKLKAVGLYAAPIKGDGNCLFNALSDQMCGDEKEKAAEYRKTTVGFMRENAADFKPFLGLFEGGGTRRNPKRKTAGSTDRSIDGEITAAQVDAAFDKGMKEMAKGGTWGGNAEAVAFANAYKLDIKIYAEAVSSWYHIEAKDNAGKDKPILYLVHHAWEHYSSIRNINGPHQGLPHAQEQSLNAESKQIPSTKDDQNSAIKSVVKGEQRDRIKVQDWQIDAVLEALPFPSNQTTGRAYIRVILEQCDGDVEYGVSLILDDSSSNSSSHSSGRSSIERDPDSDDEKEQKPSKKRNRRQSRPHPLHNNLAVAIPGKDSVIYSPSAISPDPVYLAAALQSVNKTEKETWQTYSLETSSSSSLVSDESYISPPKASNADLPKIRLKLSEPKKPETEEVSTRSSSMDDDTDSENIKNAVQDRVKAKPRRRLISGTERNRLRAEAEAKLKISPTLNAVTKDGLARTNSMKKLDAGIDSIRI